MVTTSMSLDSEHNSSRKQKVQDTVGGVLIETYITIRLHKVLSEVREVIRACKCLDLRACKGHFWRYPASGVCKNGTSINPLLLGGVCVAARSIKSIPFIRVLLQMMTRVLFMSSLFLSTFRLTSCSNLLCPMCVLHALTNLFSLILAPSNISDDGTHSVEQILLQLP